MILSGMVRLNQRLEQRLVPYIFVGYRLVQLLRIFVHLSCSPNFPRASITRCTHAKHEQILNFRTPAPANKLITQNKNTLLVFFPFLLMFYALCICCCLLLPRKRKLSFMTQQCSRWMALKPLRPKSAAKRAGNSCTTVAFDWMHLLSMACSFEWLIYRFSQG